MSLESVLKPYTSHKRVQAAEITSVGNYITNRSGSLVRAVTLAGNITIELPDEMFVRYVPEVGDYLVVYADGYKSFSPRKAFLEGYHAEGEFSPAGMENERLRSILRSCVRGPDLVELGNGEQIYLHLPHKGGAGLTEIKQELKCG